MSLKFAILATQIWLLALGASSAHAAVVDFDDQKPSSPDYILPLAGTYAGFDWTNVNVQDPNYLMSNKERFTGTGFDLYKDQGTVAFSVFDEEASFVSAAAFNLNGFDMNAVWVDSLKVIVKGYKGANTEAAYSQDLTLNRSNRDHYNFLEWRDLNKVTFTSETGNQKNFVIDNISYSVSSVPEPESYALMLAGLGLMGWMRRRKASAVA